MAGREERSGLEAVFARDVDLVAYDLGGMSDPEFEAVLSAVEVAGIRHHLSDEEELFVAESDEERLGIIFDDTADPDELAAEDDDGDGLVAQEVLSEVFSAADRLKNDGANAEAVLDLVGAADRLDGLGPPFGFGQEQWDLLRERVGGLREMLRGDTAELPTIEEAAAGLRRALQPIV